MDTFTHLTTPAFWRTYHGLPASIRNQADKQFAFLRDDPRHPSVQFKKLREKGGVELWSARVTTNYRALAVKRPTDFLWFWIGDHEAYESLIA